MDTTARFKRSLSEAFPRDHAAAIEVYRAPGGAWEWWIGAASILGCVGLFVWTLLQWAAQ